MSCLRGFEAKLQLPELVSRRDELIFSTGFGIRRAVPKEAEGKESCWWEKPNTG